MSTLIGLAIIAWSIFSSVYTLGIWEEMPKWLKVTSGIMNVIFMVIFFYIAQNL